MEYYKGYKIIAENMGYKVLKGDFMVMRWMGKAVTMQEVKDGIDKYIATQSKIKGDKI